MLNPRNTDFIPDSEYELFYHTRKGEMVNVTSLQLHNSKGLIQNYNKDQRIRDLELEIQLLNAEWERKMQQRDVEWKCEVQRLTNIIDQLVTVLNAK